MEVANQEIKSTTFESLMKTYTGPELREELCCAGCMKRGGVRQQNKLGARLPKYLAVNIDFSNSDNTTKKMVSIDVPLAGQYLRKFVHDPPERTGYKLIAFIENKKT